MSRALIHNLLCNRFDIFKTLPAYIQSRGRARRPNSQYILLINQGNKKEISLLQMFREVEVKMKEFCRLLPEDRNVPRYYYYSEGFCEEDEDDFFSQPLAQHHRNADSIRALTEAKYLKDAYHIPKTSALLTLSSSIALVYHYCTSLSSDDFCNFRPIYKIDKVSKQLPHPVDMYYCTLTLPINSALKKFEGCCNYSKDDAKMSVSLKACIALHQAGAIDDNLVPITKTRKAALKKILEQQRDEKGLQIGSRSRENDYQKTIPSFWSINKEGQNGTKATAASSAEEFVKGDEQVEAAKRKEERPMEPYWVSYIEITNTPKISPPFRKMCLITKKPLPDIPDIQIYLTNYKEGQPLMVRINNSVKLEIRFEKPKQLDLLVDYMFAILRCVTNKEFTCPTRKDVPYLLAPLKKEGSSIDWKEIKRAIRNDNNTRLSSSSVGDLEDSIVVDHSDQYHRRYFINKEEGNASMTLQSQVPKAAGSPGPKLRESGYSIFAEYYEAQQDVAKEIADKNQVLLNVTRMLKSNTYSFTLPKEEKRKEPGHIVSWLPPQLCRLFCISASVHQTCQILPWIMSRIDALLLVQDAKQQVLKLDWTKDELIMEVLTASSASLSFNYQRLEFLGGNVH